ncbi:MAG: DNA-3-methyladenine glycosylase [Candidatus Paceibacterota bacterium]
MSLHPSIEHLRKDPKFKPLIKKYGLPDLTRGKDHFQALARSIIHQQVSGKAAQSIYNKFVNLFGSGKKFPSPEKVRKTPIKKLRTAGLSGQKASYIHDLASRFTDGSIKHKNIHKLTNEEIIEHLTQVKGIGEWTAHMFLIFTLNRPDIFPTGDLGIQKGFQIVYGFKSLPSIRTMERLAKHWRAHATAASWYLWRVADGAK